MKLTLYTNRFVHDGETHVSVTVMVRRGDLDIVGSFAATSYATLQDRFECAHQTVTTAASLQRMLEDLGHTVEVDPVLFKIGELSDHLLEKVLEK